MALRLKDKQAIVKNVNEVAANALSLVVIDSRGCSVEAMTGLRKLARETKVDMRVVRNTLAKRAVEQTDFACAQEAFIGPSLLAFSMEDPGAAARLCKDFAKDNEHFEVKALAIGGQLLNAQQLDVLAKLPTIDQALSQLAGVMQAPIVKVVSTLNAIPSKLVRTIAAIRDQKQAA